MAEDKIKSDGGKTSYYWIEIPLERVKIDNDRGVVGFMLEEYIEHGLNNDWDHGNIAKANHRMGKKEGIDASYDAKKINHHNEKLKVRYGKEKEQ